MIIIVISEYVVVGKNKLCIEQNTIDDENECKKAAILTGKSNDGTITTETVRGYPKGCYVFTNGRVYFNKYSEGKKHSKSSPICKRKGTFF